MLLIGAVLVFLSGASLGALVFLCLRVASAVGASARRASWREQRVEELHARLLETLVRHHQERLDHDNAVGTIVVDHIRLVATGLAAEIQEVTSALRAPVAPETSALRAPVAAETSALQAPVAPETSALQAPVAAETSALRAPVAPPTSALRAPVAAPTSALRAPVAPPTSALRAPVAAPPPLGPRLSVSERSHTPVSGLPPVHFPLRPLNDNEPTPPSGWTLEQVRDHTRLPDG